MFSRRVFELMACGTPVVSSPSDGITAMFGALVKVATSTAEAEAHLAYLLGDDDRRARYAHAGARDVLTHHTYAHRLRTILDAVGVAHAPPSPPQITILAASNRPSHLHNIIANVRRQVHPRIELIVLLNADVFDRADVERIVRAALPDVAVQVHQLPERQLLGECLNLGIDHATGEFVAKFDDDDHYGPHYLSDLALASTYTDAEILGKNTFFAYVEPSDQMVLRHPGKAHQHTNLVGGGTLFVRRSAFERVRFSAVQPGTDSKFLRDASDAGMKIYSSDPYNYVLVRTGDPTAHTWQVSHADFLAKCRVLRTGIDFSEAMI